MSSHILEEVRVLHPQQLPRHSVFTIETLLRRVNDIGKSLALQKVNKACKQLNPLSLDQGLYLPNCRIPDEAYSLQFYFLSMDSFKRFALVQDFYRSIHSIGSPSIAFRAVEKHNP
jgi:hypothetical protein